jgi:hypothetical protein
MLSLKYAEAVRFARIPLAIVLVLAWQALLSSLRAS